jgi:nicotinamide-nucleotide amidase
MNAVIINVGKELLTGQTVNTHLSTIASQLLEIGIDVRQNYVVEDNISVLENLLSSLSEDIIILTGGLGPTEDDLTKEAVCRAYSLQTFSDERIVKKLQTYFSKKNIPVAKVNLKQAIRPVKSMVIDNENGTAPGLIIKVNDQIIILLPGPPNELNPMLEKVIAFLTQFVQRPIFQRRLYLCGIGESSIEKQRIQFASRYEGVTIYPYASIGKLQFVFQSCDKDLLTKAVSDFMQEFAPYVYTDDDRELEKVVVDTLSNKEWTISFAESCTGGLLASTIVNVPGSSIVFKEGFIVYANEAKMRRLHVSNETLNAFGAVSAECALEMVTNLQKITESNVAISVTGIAGPTGGSKEKPIGLVYFGFSIGSRTFVRKQQFTGDRNKIREHSVQYALCELLRELNKHESNT